MLLTLATGTGKTVIAFQICYKLWNSRWNRTGEPRRPRILYLADRNVLLDVPKDQTFAPFGDARWKIEGEAIKSREMYFSTYQGIAQDERRPGLYQDFPRDFFDLIIVDECHRGSARSDSSWREILEYFEPAFQLGMTATPLREDNRDTYAYFGNPLYTYSLKQGIEDGFLAPYRVHRIVSTVDAAGWRPTRGELDRYGREIPDGEYNTKDFERLVSLKVRTEAIARNVSDFLRKTNDRFAKTIVFCVDQEHAEEMRKALNNCNTDVSKDHPDYVARVVSDGRTRLLGVSNVSLRHLEQMVEVHLEAPGFVQNRCYARFGWDREVRAFCKERKIIYQGFSLLTANAEVVRHPVVTGVAAGGGATAAQVVFAFARAVGMLPLTGTSSAEHMTQDLASRSLALSPDAVRAIEGLAG
jgi:type I site-specific restriction endonuclease